MAGLRKLRGKYYVRLWIDGKEKLLPTGTGDKPTAEKHLKRLESQEIEIKQRIKTEIESLRRRLTIQDGVKKFLKSVGTERNLRRSTVYSYSLGVNDFYNALKGYVCFDCLPKESFAELTRYLQNRYNKTTVNIRLRSIRAMLRWLLEKELIDRLPFKVRQIKTDTRLPKYIKPDEMDQIYQHVINDDLRAIFRVYEFTGMRLGELANSERDGEFIVIRQSKSRRERIVPIPFDLIADYDRAKDLHYSGSWISHQFSRACRLAGVTGKTLHALRHTFALRKLIETNNISLVKELLGHSSVIVTEIYTKFPTAYLGQIFKERGINQAAIYDRINA